MPTATKYKIYSKCKPSGIDWLGDIPEGWEVKKLKYGFYFTKGKNAALYTAEYNAEHAGDHPVYSGQTEGDGTMGMINTYDYDFENVIFTTTVGAKVMTPMLLSGKFSLSQNCLLMIKASKQVFEKYFYYQLFPLFDREKSLVPSHMQPSLRFSDLNTFFVAYPKIEDQKEIVAFLDQETGRIEAVIEKKQKLIELLKEKRQALISNAVTKGLDPRAKLKPPGIDWLGNIPEGWEVENVRNLIRMRKIEIQDGNHGELHPVADDYVLDGIPFLMANNIRSQKIDFDGSKKISQEQAETLRIGFSKSDDVLFTHKGTVGETAIVPEILWKYIILTPQVTYYRILNPKIFNKFVFYIFQSNYLRNQIDLVTGMQSTRDYIGIIEQRNFVFLLPEIELQCKIVDYLDSETAKIDEVVKKVKSQIEKLTEYRQALITSAVTGKIMVN